MSLPKIEKGKPFALPDGTIIDPNANGEDKVRTVEHQVAEEQLGALLIDPTDNDVGQVLKRTLADVHADFKLMNVTMLVASYTLWGLDIPSIARVLGASEAAVQDITYSDLFEHIKQQLIEGLRYAETSTIHGFLASQTMKAAKTVVRHMNGKNADLSLNAAKDLLDRGGFRPADRVEHTMKFEDELVIRYVEHKETPIIDVELSNE